MARKRSKDLSERQTNILKIIERFQIKNGYPPTIREICQLADVSSTSVANYYLEQLEKRGFIERDRRVSRGVRLVKQLSDAVESVTTPIKQVAEAASELFRIPLLGRIAAGEPMFVPASDFAHFDPESRTIDVARSSLPAREKGTDLFALEVKGDSMIDAMVNDGDVVIMKPAKEARNGEMVAIWLNNKDETTLKFFFFENGQVRLQPANPTMEAWIISDPSTVEIKGRVVMVIRQVKGLPI